MSFNQPPPNPYGQQPQQPGPPPGYGYPQQGGVPQQPGPYGYPQQQPQNPYGQTPPPPNPYGVQPNPAYGQQPPGPAYGQQGGWATPPPQKKNTTKIIAIVVAAVVVVGGGIGIAVSMGGGGGAAASGPKYKLTTPETVAGDFKKQAGSSDSNSDDLDNTPGITDAHDVQGGYASGTTKQLEFFGAYGTIDDPSSVVDSAFTELDKQSASGNDTDGKAVGSPQSVSPSGLSGDAVMKCQIFSTDEDGISAKFPICIWGDSSTVGVVAYVDGTAVVTGGSVSVEDGAKITAEVRDSTRVKIPS